MPKQTQIINTVVPCSRCVLAFSLITFISCLLISYSYADYFSLSIQVSAHILTLIFAGIFKVAVVAHMAATHKLNSLNVYLSAKDNYVAT